MKKTGNNNIGSYRAALAPYSVWSLLFTVVPLIFVAYYAFTDNNFAFTTENITRFFTATSNIVQDDGTTAEVRTYVLIFLRSLKLAVISTVICLWRNVLKRYFYRQTAPFIKYLFQNPL